MKAERILHQYLGSTFDPIISVRKLNHAESVEYRSGQLPGLQQGWVKKRDEEMSGNKSCWTNVTWMMPISKVEFQKAGYGGVTQKPAAKRNSVFCRNL
jgi:hypothetical protein